MERKTKQSRAGRVRRMVGILLALMGIGLGAHALAPAAEARVEAPPTVTLLGETLSLDADPQAEAARLAAAALAERVVVRNGDREVEASWAELGVIVDTEGLSRLLAEAQDPASALRRDRRSADRDSSIELRLTGQVDLERTLEVLAPLKEALDQQAVEARVDLASGAVRPDREGRSVDLWATVARLDAAFEAGQSEVPLALERTPAHRTASQLTDVELGNTLGDFETRYNTLEVARDRTHNLRVVASRVHGTVLMPGEVFDYNEVVGERSQANGFKPAPVIAGGELVDGVGGGACQVSGTLHAAVFFAGLPVLERHPHSRPSSYIKLGLDAAVSYPQLNFRFRNDLGFPIAIELTVEGGVTRAAIRGAERSRLVSFVRRIDEVLPFAERETEDPELPRGIQVLSQRGVPGFRVTRWRILRDAEQNQAIQQALTQDNYPPTTQVWRVGTGGPAPEGYVAPSGDGHLEYRADQYTVLSQGPGVDGIRTVRTSGRTGAPGWTVRAGMPAATRE